MSMELIFLLTKIRLEFCLGMDAITFNEKLYLKQLYFCLEITIERLPVMQ
jgi:hypothetical protein